MDKTALFEATFKKLSADSTFMAYHLQQLTLKQNITRAQLIESLSCSAEEFYKLALCKAPAINADDFQTRLENIAAYTNVPGHLLQKIIIGFTTEPAKPQKSSQFEKWLNFKLTWLTGAPQVVACQAALLFCIILFASVNTKAGNIKPYIATYTFYTDSIRHLQLSDNTGVYKNKL